METRHVRAALSARIAKTDRKDARGMADLLRMGWFRPVHVKSMDAREHRALLTARSTLVRRLKDIENSVRGLLRGFGIKLATTLRAQWDTKVRDAIAGHPALPVILEPLLVAVRPCATRSPSLISGSATQPARTRSAGRLMTMPGVGPIVAITYRAAVDEPQRFGSSKSVGASF